MKIGTFATGMTREQKSQPPMAGGFALKGTEFSSDAWATIQTYGWSWSSYNTMYRKQPAVRRAVNFLARNIAQLNPKVYERRDNSDRVELDTHPLAERLRSPNPSTTRFAHLRDTVSDLALYDRAFWLRMRLNGPRTRAIVRIPPSRIMKTVNQNTGNVTYQIETTDGPRAVPRDQLVIFQGYSPDGDDEGVSPLETLRQVLAEEWASMLHRESYWHNAARQSGWIERPLDAPDWSDDARKRFRADIESTVTGAANSGRIGIIEDGMTWNGTAFSPKESEYLGGRKLTNEEVATTYGIAPALLSGSDENKANIESFHRQMYQDTLAPWLTFLQDEIMLQLLPEYEAFNAEGRIYVEFNLAEKLKGSFEEQGKTLVTAVGVPYMTPNEGRARLNLPRIDDPAFDLPIQPLNVMYGGQPAVTVPTEEPEARSDDDLQTKARDEEVTRHEARLQKFFKRQEQAVLSAIGAKGEWWDGDRWDRELVVDLFSTAGFLNGETTVMAHSINADTLKQLEAELKKEGDARVVFAHAKDERARGIAQELADKGAEQNAD